MAGSPLMLPDSLAGLLNELGFMWPKSDEVQMFELGSKWMEVGGELSRIQGESQQPVRTIEAENQGRDIEAFAKQWKDQDRGSEVLKDGGEGATLVGPGLFVAAGLVLALKITVIVQLTLLAVQIASALAAAVATFGASLAWIPVAKRLAGMAIDFMLGKVVEGVLG